MGKNAPSAPVLDYEAQGRLNREAYQTSLEGMNPDTYGPYGSVTHTGTPGEGDYARHINLSPEQQRIFNAQMGAGGERSDLGFQLATQLRDYMSTPADFDQFGEAQTIGNYGDRRDAAQDAAYQRMTARLDPRFEQEGEAMDVKLRSQGLQPGDQAYDNAMRNFNMAKNDAYSSAMSDAFGQGRAETQLAFGQEMGGAGFNNQVRQQNISDMLRQRGWGLNEVNALMSGQDIRNPTIAGQNAPQMNAVDMLGTQQQNYQNQLQGYGIDQQRLNSMMQAGALMYGGGM